MYTFIAFNCVGHIMNISRGKRHDNPFISMTFINEKSYVKFCKNFNHYVREDPVIINKPLKNTKWREQNGNNGWYNEDTIKPGYIIMLYDDIEIHCIHDTDITQFTDMFNRRRARFLEELPTPIFLLSSGDFLLDWSDEEYEEIVRDFTRIPNTVFLSRVNLAYPNIYFQKEWEGALAIRNKTRILSYTTIGKDATKYKKIVRERYGIILSDFRSG